MPNLFQCFQVLCNISNHIEIGQLIYRAKRLTYFYVSGTGAETD